MKLAGTPNPAACGVVDAIIRRALREAIDAERITVMEAVYLLARMMPEYAERDFVIGHLWGAYDLASARGLEPLMRTEEIVPLLQAAGCPIEPVAAP